MWSVGHRSMYEEGLSGYTFLEREVDASFIAGHGQLRLVAPKSGASGKASVPPIGTGS